jgi:LysR family transcriptional activator of nhaA
MENRPTDRRKVLKVGSVATLSRNFQLSCVRTFIGREDVELILRSGSMADLLGRLKRHTVDLVLSNLPVRRDAETNWHSHLLEEQAVSLVGVRPKTRRKFCFPEDLKKVPVILPSLDSHLRVAFDLVMERHGIRPLIAAEIDDMAMMRLLAAEGAGLALVPPVVVAGELKSKLLVERYRFPDIKEKFYAISPSRRYPNPLVDELIAGAKKQTKN